MKRMDHTTLLAGLALSLMSLPVLAQTEGEAQQAPATTTATTGTAGEGDLRSEIEALKKEIQAMRGDMRAVLTELRSLKAAQAQAGKPQQPQKRPAEELLGKPAPEVSFKLNNNEERKLGGKSDKVKVAIFYATWCGFCKRALPGFDQLQKDFAGKDVEIMAISLDDKEGARAKTEADLVALMEQLKVTVPFHWDAERKIGNPYKVQSFPTSFVVGKSGLIEAVHVGGPVGLDKTIAEEVNKLLAGESLVKAPAPAKS